MKDDAQEKIQTTRLVWLGGEEILKRRRDKFRRKQCVLCIYEYDEK